MKVAIIGSGQQGGSIARALANAGNYTVSTFDISPEVSDEFEEITEDLRNIAIYGNITYAVENADVVVLATPIDQFGPVLQEINGRTKDGVIITDVGSGKVKAIEEIQANLPRGASYIPAHPIVGKAQSGPSASDPDMYKGETIVVVPTNEPPAQELVQRMWQDMGGTIAHMDGATHDRLYGTISHFEHVVAFALVAAGENDMDDYKKAGNTMLDTTRIAGGASPDMWIPIFRDNNDAVLAAAEGFTNQLTKIQEALKEDTPQTLTALLEPAHEFRKSIKNDRIRETIVGEQHDLLAENKAAASATNLGSNKLADVFYRAYPLAFVKRTLVPTTIGAALTLNAIDTEENHLSGVQISEVANPSFKDGSAPMLNHPQYVAQFLFDNKADMQSALDAFRVKYDELVDAIRRNDADAIRAYMEHVSELRQSMPAHKPESEMRDTFAFEN